MAGLWQRHPRYLISLSVVIFFTFYLFYPLRSNAGIQPLYVLKDDNLSNRLARSERIYERTLIQRQGLIKKFGPRPKDVMMFPPDKAPWPAYTVWNFFPPAFNCPHELERLGKPGDGGKWFCGLSRLAEKEDCIVYSFGNKYEASFEAEVLEKTRHCQVWAYDLESKSLGSDIPWLLSSRTHFKSYGLSNVDQHGPSDKPPVYTLESLMKLNGHSSIDVLKIDIEGWEFAALNTTVNSFLAADKPLPFGQLLIELHIWQKNFAELLGWWESLEAAGLRPFSSEPNLIYQNYNKQGTTDLAEYSFLNIKGDNIFIKNPEAIEL